MRKGAITVDFHDGSRPLVVVGDVTTVEYGRYLLLGCSIKPYVSYNKNDIPIVNKEYRWRPADFIAGAGLHIHDVAAKKKIEVPGITLSLDEEFPFFMMKFNTEGGN